MIIWRLFFSNQSFHADVELATGTNKCFMMFPTPSSQGLFNLKKLDLRTWINIQRYRRYFFNCIPTQVVPVANWFMTWFVRGQIGRHFFAIPTLQSIKSKRCTHSVSLSNVPSFRANRSLILYNNVIEICEHIRGKEGLDWYSKVPSVNRTQRLLRWECFSLKQCPVSSVATAHGDSHKRPLEEHRQLPLRTDTCEWEAEPSAALQRQPRPIMEVM